MRAARRLVLVLLVPLALAGLPAGSAIAKTCGPGYTHAVVPGGAHKCLRTGEYCSHRSGYARVYARAGFVCGRDGRLH